MTVAASEPRRRRRRAAADFGAGPLGLGITTLWLSIIVLLPLAAVVVKAFGGGFGEFFDAAFSRQGRSALIFTIWISLVVTAINAVMGTMTAWVMVRDDFPGKKIINGLLDLPFALPTIVAGITMLALYGDAVAYTKWAVLLALVFVTLPFCVRAVQPVLLELDREVEEAASSLGAGPFTTFRRVILPSLVPAIISGSALTFARAVGEFGSLILISGNIPFDTQVASVFIFKQIESDNPMGAASVSVVLLVLSLVVLIGMRFVEKRVVGNAEDHE